MYEEPQFLLAGDTALVVELGDAISPEVNRRVHNLVHAIEDQNAPEVIDLVPTYRSLLVQYDPLQTSLDELKAWLAEAVRTLDEREAPEARVVQLPTLYGGDYGPDLEYVAEHASLATEEVVAAHSGTDYLVYMMGFTPGFPYLGGLSEELATPRLDTPRSEIPAGSVGIAERQTGVYPVASPGGWRLIGRSPLTLFDPLHDPPSLLAAGDYVRFVPLSGEDAYHRIRKAVESGEYRVLTAREP